MFFFVLRGISRIDTTEVFFRKKVKTQIKIISISKCMRREKYLQNFLNYWEINDKEKETDGIRKETKNGDNFANQC